MRVRLLALRSQLAGPFAELFPAPEIEDDAVFRAIHFEGRLTDQVLILPQLGVQLVDARSSRLLLRFDCGDGLR